MTTGKNRLCFCRWYVGNDSAPVNERTVIRFGNERIEDLPFDFLWGLYLRYYREAHNIEIYLNTNKSFSILGEGFARTGLNGNYESFDLCQFAALKEADYVANSIIGYKN